MSTTTQIPPTDVRNRRTPYHCREAYIAGNAAKKAKIIRACITLGHPVHTADGRPVIGANSVSNQLVLQVSHGKSPERDWTNAEPVFTYVPKGYVKPKAVIVPAKKK